MEGLGLVNTLLMCVRLSKKLNCLLAFRDWLLIPNGARFGKLVRTNLTRNLYTALKVGLQLSTDTLLNHPLQPGVWLNGNHSKWHLLWPFGIWPTYTLRGSNSFTKNRRKFHRYERAFCSVWDKSYPPMPRNWLICISHIWLIHFYTLYSASYEELAPMAAIMLVNSAVLATGIWLPMMLQA